MKDCPSFALYLIESGSVDIYNRLYVKGIESTSKSQKTARGDPTVTWSDVSRTKADGGGLIMPLATLLAGDVMGELELFAAGDDPDQGALNTNYAIAGGSATGKAMRATLATLSEASLRERARQHLPNTSHPGLRRHHHRTCAVAYSCHDS